MQKRFDLDKTPCSSPPWRVVPVFHYRHLATSQAHILVFYLRKLLRVLNSEKYASSDVAKPAFLAIVRLFFQTDPRVRKKLNTLINYTRYKRLFTNMSGIMRCWLSIEVK